MSDVKEKVARVIYECLFDQDWEALGPSGIERALYMEAGAFAVEEYREHMTDLEFTVRREPVLDRDTVDILRAVVHATDIIREKGTLMPFMANVLLNWAADHAADVIRDHANWIKEHGA